MSPEIALYAAAIAAALVGIGSLLKALRAGRSQGYELFSDSEEGTGDSGGIGDSERGTGDSGGTGTEDEPLAQQTFVIPLAFSVLLVLDLVFLARSNPSWQIILKAGPGLCYILCQSIMASWTPVETGRTVFSLILNMWMLWMPFLQCQWWLFGLSSATCIVSAVVLHCADLDQDIHCYGLAASLIAAWLAALTVLSTWSLVSLLLTAPGMIGFHWIPVMLKSLEGGNERELQIAPFHSALLSLYLIWSMPLPLLTNASWQLLAAVVLAGFGWAARRVNVLEIGLFGAVALVIATLLPWAVVWWSGEVPQLLEAVPLWMLRFVPLILGVMYIWMEVVHVYLLMERQLYWIDYPIDSIEWGTNNISFGRADIMTRILVLLILLATPWALALDTAQLQQWGQVPDLYLPDYLTLQFGQNQTWRKIETWHLPNATWHRPKEYFLHMTQPRWPDLATATNSMARAKFWLLFMTIKLAGTTVFAMLVLGMPCSQD